MTLKTNKKMINFFIGIGILAGVLTVISLAGYRIYTGKANEEKEKKAIEQRGEIQDKVIKSRDSLANTIEKGDSLILDKIDTGKKEILKKQDATQRASRKKQDESTKKIIDKIENTSKEQKAKQDDILNKIEELPSAAYKELNSKTKNKIIRDFKKIKSGQQQFPYVVIEVESGNSQRHRVALELESILSPLEMGGYGKGNTFIGRFPNYPISVFCHTSKTDEAKMVIDVLSDYIKKGFTIRPDENYHKNVIKFYFNGIPEFYRDGSLEFN